MYAFQFYDCIPTVMPTGKWASNLREFLYLVREVEPSVIFHHVYQARLKQHFDLWEYPNDFAGWAADCLEDMVLAEKLASFNPYNYASVDEVRETVIETVEEHLWDKPTVPWVRPGFEFFFNDSKTVVIPTEVECTDLPGFLKALRQVPNGCIYFHFYEARLRLGNRDRDDFSYWIEHNLRFPNLVRRIHNMDFYFLSLGEMKKRLIRLVEGELNVVTSP
ncbi:MAG: DUF5752 family protein [Pseudomonadota bacterium]